MDDSSPARVAAGPVMSRSTYVYVVTGDPAQCGWPREVPLAAFTVKHELIKWLIDMCADRAAVHVTRLRDGVLPGLPVRLDPMTLDPIPEQ